MSKHEKMLKCFEGLRKFYPEEHFSSEVVQQIYPKYSVGWPAIKTDILEHSYESMEEDYSS